MLIIFYRGVLCNFYTVGAGSFHLQISHELCTEIGKSTTQNFQKMKSSKVDVTGLGAIDG